MAVERRPRASVPLVRSGGEWGTRTGAWRGPGQRLHQVPQKRQELFVVIFSSSIMILKDWLFILNTAFSNAGVSDICVFFYSHMAQFLTKPISDGSLFQQCEGNSVVTLRLRHVIHA